jgi:hypothetical protein
MGGSCNGSDEIEFQLIMIFWPCAIEVFEVVGGHSVIGGSSALGG